MIPGGVQRSGETAGIAQRRPVPTQRHSGLQPHQHAQQMCVFDSSWFEVSPLTLKQCDSNN